LVRCAHQRELCEIRERLLGSPFGQLALPYRSAPDRRHLEVEQFRRRQTLAGQPGSETFPVATVVG
jgi:hypothetical protein